MSQRDDPREGLDEVTLTVHTLSQARAVQHETDSLECSLRSDIAGLLERFPGAIG
ncbi:hypothetical protein [Streptomyces goshikiensis]|uniref:hypothetical protein n=1 Tax=Streptomyces goshikiensis TaxID=1942 RepID=UPI0036C82CEC